MSTKNYVFFRIFLIGTDPYHSYGTGRLVRIAEIFFALT